MKFKRRKTKPIKDVKWGSPKPFQEKRHYDPIDDDKVAFRLPRKNPCKKIGVEHDLVLIETMETFSKKITIKTFKCKKCSKKVIKYEQNSEVS